MMAQDIKVLFKQYSDFIKEVRNCMKENIENPFTTAINRSIKNGVLSEYLKRRKEDNLKNAVQFF